MANEQTRLKILQVSIELFYEKGYDAVGVQEIADKCELTKPALYYHFKNKSGILEGIMQQYIDPVVVKLRKVVNNSSSFEDSLHNFAYCYVSEGCENLHLYLMLMTMQYSPPMSEFNNAFIRHCTEINNIVKSIFINARGLLGNMNGRENQFATTFLGMIGFHMYEYHSEKEPKMDKSAVDMIIHQFLHGIYS